VPASVPGFLRQRRRWFCGFLQTQFWNRDMIGNRRFGYLGTAMMPVKTLDTLQPLYGLAAFAILLFVLATGQYAVALPIVLVMLAKIALDLAFHLWSLGIYARWTGAPALKLRPSLLAVLAEPFTFQLLRHAGAAWGWFAFLAGRHTWHRQARTALTEARLRAPF
jgi:cellulose synthase/poly-beta-1,6-N-acetylglucosamine synthase-like glycosyltransferase